MKQFATLPTITAAQIGRALFTLCALVMAYTIQHTGHALTIATRAALKAYRLTRATCRAICGRYSEPLTAAAIFAACVVILYISASCQAARM